MHCYAEAVCLRPGPGGITHRAMVLRPSITHAHTNILLRRGSSFTSTRINMQSGLMETPACERRGSSYHSQFSVFPPIFFGQLRRNHNINKDFFLISSTIDHTLLILEEILVIKMIYNSTFSLYIGFSSASSEQENIHGLYGYIIQSELLNFSCYIFLVK